MATNDPNVVSVVSNAKKHYVYDLPYDVRKKLWSILDMNDCWKELGESTSSITNYSRSIIHRRSVNTVFFLFEYSFNRWSTLKIEA